MKTAVFVLFLVSPAEFSCARAQEYTDTGESAYGYTSLTFDASTNQLTAYSETDLDPDLQDYYNAYLKLSLVGPNGTLVSGSNEDLTGAGNVSLTLTATGQNNSTYTATGTHYGIMQETVYDPGGQTFYDDPYQLFYWESQAIDDNTSLFEFYDPGQYLYRERNPNINLGSTVDSGTIQTPATCGDVRTTIIAEYYTNGLSYHPVCADFTLTVPAGSPYSFTALNQGSFIWAILQSTFFSGVQSFVTKYGSAPTAISGYRDPFKEQAVDLQLHRPYTRNSRHSYGDAIDLSTNKSVVSIFNAIRAVGILAGVC